MTILAALLFAGQVPDYHELPQRDPHTEQVCNAAIKSVEVFVAEYQSYVSRHEMDEGGNLTADEAAFYRGEADRFVRDGLAELRDMRFSNINPEFCTFFADSLKYELTHQVAAKRFGPYKGYRRGPDGRWSR